MNDARGLIHRRLLLQGSLAGLLGGGTATLVASESRAESATPWARRLLRVYTGADAEAYVEELPLPGRVASETQTLLRELAYRVTIGAMPPNHRIDWHVANYPTLLIPLEGSLYLKVGSGKEYLAMPGDIVRAEDLTGRGHISGAGPEGVFSVAVQLPRPDGTHPDAR